MSFCSPYEYNSEADAGAYRKFHPNCDCVIVPSDKGRTKIDGYDPETMYENWKACRDTTGGRKAAREAWDVLSESKKDEYRERHGDDESEAFGAFYRNRIMREVETRDWLWLYTGEGATVDYSRLTKKQISDLAGYEIDTWSSLAKLHGIASTILPEIDAPANIDALICGDLWELKNPKGGKRAIEDRIKEGVSKWQRLGLTERPRIIVSNSESDRPDELALNEAIRRCDWYGVGELLFVSHDGTWIRRVKFKKK